MNEENEEYVKYPVIWAHNYEVSNNGEIFKIKPTYRLITSGNKRCTITYNNGEKKKITPSVVFEKSRINYIKHELEEKWHHREAVRMSGNFGSYFIDSNADIYNYKRPSEPLTYDKYNCVRLYGEDHKMHYINRFKMLAIHILGQYDVGPVVVADFYFGLHHGANIKSGKLTSKRVQIVNESIANYNPVLLEYYPGYCVIYSKKGYFVVECATGVAVDFKLGERHRSFKLPYNKPIYDVSFDEKGKAIPEFKKNELLYIEVPLNELHLDPALKGKKNKFDDEFKEWKN